MDSLSSVSGSCVRERFPHVPSHDLSYSMFRQKTKWLFTAFRPFAVCFRVFLCFPLWSKVRVQLRTDQRSTFVNVLEKIRLWPYSQVGNPALECVGSSGRSRETEIPHFLYAWQKNHVPWRCHSWRTRNHAASQAPQDFSRRTVENLK